MAAEPDAAADSFGDWEQVHFTTTNETPVSAASVTPIDGDELLPPPPPPGEDGSGGDTRSSRVWRRMEVLKSGMIGVVERVLRRCGGGGGGGGVWSCLVMAAAVLMYVKLVKWRRWVREETASRFALLIREKDEKIRQLMLEIARLEEMLIATRGSSRVHVFRFYQSRNVGL